MRQALAHMSQRRFVLGHGAHGACSMSVRVFRCEEPKQRRSSPAEAAKPRKGSGTQETGFASGV